MTAPHARPALTCPLCGSSSFTRQESRQDSRWGFTSHVMHLLICQQCSYVLHFWGGNSMFDVD